MTLTEFLLARIAEDEQRAHYALTYGDSGALEYGGQWYGAIKHAERWEPARVLAECDVKTEIVGLYEDSQAADMSADSWALMKMVLGALAVPYADHPDYLQEWKP